MGDEYQISPGFGENTPGYGHGLAATWSPQQSGQMPTGSPMDFMSMMQALGGKGLFGLGDMATGGLFGFAGNLLGGLGGLLGGKSDAEKRADQVYSMAKNRIGQNVLNPDQYLADYLRAAAPRMNMQAQGMERRLGLDSGVAQGEMAYNMEAPLAQFMLQAKQQNDMLKNQNDNNLMSIMASLGGRG